MPILQKGDFGGGHVDQVWSIPPALLEWSPATWPVEGHAAVCIHPYVGWSVLLISIQSKLQRSSGIYMWKGVQLNYLLCYIIFYKWHLYSIKLIGIFHRLYNNKGLLLLSLWYFHSLNSNPSFNYWPLLFGRKNPCSEMHDKNNDDVSLMPFPLPFKY